MGEAMLVAMWFWVFSLLYLIFGEYLKIRDLCHFIADHSSPKLAIEQNSKTQLPKVRRYICVSGGCSIFMGDAQNQRW
jgi:hypothetical protein